MHRNGVTVVLLAAVSLIGTTYPAFAYLDPGTGGMVTTAIMGFFAAILFTLRKYFYKVARLFRGDSADSSSATKIDSD